MCSAFREWTCRSPIPLLRLVLRDRAPVMVAILVVGSVDGESTRRTLLSLLERAAADSDRLTIPDQIAPVAIQEVLPRDQVLPTRRKLKLLHRRLLFIDTEETKSTLIVATATAIGQENHRRDLRPRLSQKGTLCAFMIQATVVVRLTHLCAENPTEFGHTGSCLTATPASHCA